MATISFADLDQSLDINDTTLVAYASSEAEFAFNFSYFTTNANSHDYEINGSGFTYSGGLPTGGTVNSIQLDLDNDSGASAFEIDISGLSIAATSLGIGVGTAEQQRDTFWAVALGGADTFNFTMANYTVDLRFAGDGALVSDGQLHTGANDTFADGGTALTGVVVLAGDYYQLVSGVAVGGDDLFTVGAYAQYGDFRDISVGATGIGGDDRIAPARYSDAAGSLGPYYIGDARIVSGALFGGADLIDLRSTVATGWTQGATLVGDAGTVASTGAVIGGNDTIHGSSLNDSIHGDYQSNSGYVEGGKDRLFGYAGNDTIRGNEGRDQLYGGDGDDNLDGGLDGDIIDGGIGNDLMVGDTGNDSMLGGDGNDTMIGGSGSDTIDGGIGDDVSDASAGTDVMIGGTGKDSLFGGTGNDSITGDAGNDTLQGGDNNDTIIGSAGYDLLLGGNDNDFLDGGALNDVLFGNAGIDTFNFAIGGGTDTIRDMAAGIGLNDVIRLEGFGAAFDSFAEVMAAATDNGTDTTINFGGGNVLIIQNVTVAGFNTDDFIFG